MRRNWVYKGNCVKIISEKIASKSVDLVFADPPYNISGNGLKCDGRYSRSNAGSGAFKLESDWFGVDAAWDRLPYSKYLWFTSRWISECFRVLKDNGSIYVSSSFHNIAEIILVLRNHGFKVNNIIVWRRPNSVPNLTRRVFTHSCEFVVWAVKGKGWRFNYEELKKINPEKRKNGDLKQMRDVWDIPLVQGRERLRKSDGKALHPTQKPEELLRRIIIASSSKEAMVLDPFFGTGTTGVVAKSLGRHFVGIEKSKRYIQAARKRLKGVRGVDLLLSKSKLRYHDLNHDIKAEDGLDIVSLS